jgi:DNA-binding response OmpR family regulator
VADDEPHVLELLRLTLGARYEIITAEDGEEALALLEKHKPDLLILDVMMPKVNGFEICERLKADPKTRKIRIAILSAKAREEDIIRGLELGADYYLTKPFDPVELEKQVDEMLK